MFENNLKLQEANITEPGEKEATEELRKNFTELIANPADLSNYPQLRQSLQAINDFNQGAIQTKNKLAQHNAETAKFWLTLIFTILIIVTLTFSYNFPDIIAGPVTKLADGIKAIANKDYNKRIYMERKDEFGELANAFNTMAEKLDEYEHSNLAQLMFEKKRIETIINQMNDGIIGLDAKGNILFLNAVSEKLLAVKETSIIGKYAPDVAVGNDLMRSLLQGDTKAELKIFADNQESYFNKDIINVSANNEVIGKVIVLRNITPFYELNEAKTNFIATVSHELKTPIASIKMSATLLTDTRVGALNTDQQELIKSIGDDVDRLLKITSELLNMSQVETGNIQLKIEPVSANEIVEQALQAVQFQAQQKNIQIKTHFAEHLQQLNADSEKTTWVLINYLTNAIKYSSALSFIEIDITQDNKSIKFTVKDYGRGIDQKYLPKIFDRYFKVPDTQERSGTGLGLAISRQFIEAQGGGVWVESTPGEGSLFGFWLNAV
jgi:signal transduction histidine kinase